MDIQIERKKGLRILFAKRSLPYWGGMLFLLFAAWLLLRVSMPARSRSPK